MRASRHGTGCCRGRGCSPCPAATRWLGKAPGGTWPSPLRQSPLMAFKIVNFVPTPYSSVPCIFWRTKALERLQDPLTGWRRAFTQEFQAVHCHSAKPASRPLLLLLFVGFWGEPMCFTGRFKMICSQRKQRGSLFVRGVTLMVMFTLQLVFGVIGVYI